MYLNLPAVDRDTATIFSFGMGHAEMAVTSIFQRDITGPIISEDNASGRNHLLNVANEGVGRAVRDDLGPVAP